MDERKHCGDCEHYDFAGSMIAGSKVVLCMAGPPTPIQIRVPEGMALTAMHPQVQDRQRACGQFKAKAVTQ